METVFDAENNVEAHMIVHLLARSEIEASIMGEHLQGGVGELPAHGNIRVVVEPSDALAARKIISEWESDRRTDPSTQPREPRESTYSGLVAFFVGAGILLRFCFGPITRLLIPVLRTTIGTVTRTSGCTGAAKRFPELTLTEITMAKLMQDTTTQLETVPRKPSLITTLMGRSSI